MNQYDLFIRDYLNEQKSVSFEKIGTLSFNDKSKASELPQPLGALTFEFDKKAVTSPGLIVYIAERTNKNKGLILSDLESYIELMRQFINIGKPYEMEGVGIFKLAKSNEYEFIAYDLSANIEDQKNTKKQQAKNNANLVVKKSSDKSALMVLAILIVLGVLGVIGWGTYKLFLGNGAISNKDTINTTVTNPANDTAAGLNTMPHTDTITATAPLIQSDTSDYKFIFETTAVANRAYLRTEQLKKLGHPSGYDSVATDSGHIYTLYLKMHLKNADTTLTKDSLQKYLSRKIKIAQIK